MLSIYGHIPGVTAHILLVVKYFEHCPSKNLWGRLRIVLEPQNSIPCHFRKGIKAWKLKLLTVFYFSYLSESTYFSFYYSFILNRFVCSCVHTYVLFCLELGFFLSAWIHVCVSLHCSVPIFYVVSQPPRWPPWSCYPAFASHCVSCLPQ